MWSLSAISRLLSFLHLTGEGKVSACYDRVHAVLLVLQGRHLEVRTWLADGRPGPTTLLGQTFGLNAALDLRGILVIRRKICGFTSFKQSFRVLFGFVLGILA